MSIRNLYVGCLYKAWNSILCAHFLNNIILVELVYRDNLKLEEYHALAISKHFWQDTSISSFFWCSDTDWPHVWKCISWHLHLLCHNFIIFPFQDIVLSWIVLNNIWLDYLVGKSSFWSNVCNTNVSSRKGGKTHCCHSHLLVW